MIDKLVGSAASQFSGNLIQFGSLSFVGFGIEFGFDKIAILLGLLISLIGLLITLHSAKVQKKTNKREEQVAILEMEKIEMEKEVLRRTHPELFKNK